MDDSVPASDLDKINKEYVTLTEKYRDLLEKSNVMVTNAEQQSGFEVAAFLLLARHNDVILDT